MAGVGVCVCSQACPALGFLPGDTWDPEKEENNGARQPQNGE